MKLALKKEVYLSPTRKLRERFRLSKAVRAANTSEAIYSQLLELEGVDHARIYENMTDAVDLKGLPPHSFMAVVLGGTTTDIGELFGIISLLVLLLRKYTSHCKRFTKL